MSESQPPLGFASAATLILLSATTRTRLIATDFRNAFASNHLLGVGSVEDAELIVDGLLRLAPTVYAMPPRRVRNEALHHIGTE
jgi:hypothetical protein